MYWHEGDGYLQRQNRSCITNGAREEIIELILDEREPPISKSESRIQLA